MRRSGLIAATILALFMALAPGLGLAAAGSSRSFGSRGSRTFMAPPPTTTAPGFAAPMERSLTPQAPSYAPNPGYNPGFGSPRPAFGFGGHPFVSGLMGGLLGAGLGGMLFGHGFFGGGMGGFGMIGLLLQLFLLFLVVRWLFRRFVGPQPALAGGMGGLFARGPQSGGFGGPARGPVRPSPAAARPVAITDEDYRAFEQLLQRVQQAWSNHDLNTLRQVASPEMVSYFAEQLAEQTSRGVRNVVSNVQLLQGDLSEAWAEDNREYATVAMRFAAVDVTVDATGRVVDGSPNERVTLTEVWTFLRAPGGRWVLSAIQQTR